MFVVDLLVVQEEGDFGGLGFLNGDFFYLVEFKIRIGCVRFGVVGVLFWGFVQNVLFQDIYS